MPLFLNMQCCFSHDAAHIHTEDMVLNKGIKHDFHSALILARS